MAAKTKLVMVVFSTFSFFEFTGGLLDIDELKSVHYGIDILNNPVVLGQNEPPSAVYLTSKFGQQYQCSFPDHTEQDKQKEEEEKLAVETGIPELLRPLESGPCLIKVKDWWTYEFCYGKYIRQYHVEDGKIAGDIIYLGLFESEFDWNSESNKELAAKNKNRLNRYHSQQYVNGTKCDLTGTPRRAEVRFLCEEGSGDSIAQIEESASCVYVLTVHTTKICHHPNLRPPSVSHSVPITCNPIVSHDIYSKYLLGQEVEKKRSEDLVLLERLRKGHFDEGSLTNEERIKNILKSVINKEKEKKEILKEQPNPEDTVIGDRKIETNSEVTTPEHKLQENPDGINDQDQELLDEFDEGLDDLSLDEEDSEALASMKEDIAEAMQEQFTDIIKETETELASDGVEVEEQIDIAEAQKQMAKTLSKLLKRLKKVEKDVDEAEEVVREQEDLKREQEDLKREQEDLKREQEDLKREHEDLKREQEELSDDTEAIKDSTDTDLHTTQQHREQSNIVENEATQTIENPDTPTTDDINRVKVRITRVKSGDTGKTAGKDIPDSQRETIETAVKDELEKAGIDSDGSKIQVKIITAGYYDTDEEMIHVLSSEDSAAFNKMVVAILGGSGEAEMEEKQHNNMLENYNMVWGKDKKRKRGALYGS